MELAPICTEKYVLSLPSNENVHDVEASYCSIHWDIPRASLDKTRNRYQFIGIRRYISFAYFSQFNRYEIANALSMVFPVLVSFALCAAFPSRCNKFTSAVSWATLIHLPFSFAYHWYMSLPNPEENWALTYHRLDASFIHAVSSLYAYGISENVAYAFLTVPVNLIPVIMLWRSDSRVPNTTHIGVSVALYLLPYLLSNAIPSFVLVSFAFWITLWTWERKCFGEYYHSLMHVMMGIPQAFIVLSAMDLLPTNRIFNTHTF